MCFLVFYTPSFHYILEMGTLVVDLSVIIHASNSWVKRIVNANNKINRLIFSRGVAMGQYLSAWLGII